MALNNCTICNKWYWEDEGHPCICPDCQKENESKLKAKNFFEEIQKM